MGIFLLTKNLEIDSIAGILVDKLAEERQSNTYRKHIKIECDPEHINYQALNDNSYFNIVVASKVNNVIKSYVYDNMWLSRFEKDLKSDVFINELVL